MSFIGQFLKDPIKTGALTPSSKKLSELMIGRVNLLEKKCVVELGPGTGVFTKEIIQQISTRTVFFSLEISETFVKETKHNCPDATIYHSSAIDIKKYLLKHHQETSDCIMSGLPWGAFGKKLQENLLSEIYGALNQGGEFLTIAYAIGTIFPPGIRFKRLLHEKFTEVKTSQVIWRNVFPAFVYHCVK